MPPKSKEAETKLSDAELLHRDQFLSGCGFSGLRLMDDPKYMKRIIEKREEEIRTVQALTRYFMDYLTR